MIVGVLHVEPIAGGISSDPQAIGETDETDIGVAILLSITTNMEARLWNAKGR